MNMLARYALVTVTALGLAVAASAAVQVGQPAPDFSLTDTHGKTHKLSDLKGKVVVLEWINLGCPYVNAQYEARNLQALQATYTGKEVVWFSVCSSAKGQQGHMAPGEWNGKIKELGIASTAVLNDEAGTVGRLFGAKTTPHMYVIDQKGLVAYNGALDSAASTRKDEILKASNYVAAAVDALLAGKPVGTATTRPFGCGIKYK